MPVGFCVCVCVITEVDELLTRPSDRPAEQAQLACIWFPNLGHTLFG